jgi:hypothetical protein
MTEHTTSLEVQNESEKAPKAENLVQLTFLAAKVIRAPVAKVK